MLISQPFPSPIGLLHLVAHPHGDALAALTLPNRPPPPGGVREGSAPVLAIAARQLAEYFAGERTEFDLPLRPEGTAFQHTVWDQLVKIPFGATCTYQSIAIALGRKSGSRAVGAANGRNPIAIVVPCHRVIGADGSLTGYAGGLDVKKALLAHEAKVAATVGAPCGTSRVSSQLELLR